jgi:endonuclease/exonuclease/phosphatase family metal-dependent hydrolase
MRMRAAMLGRKRLNGLLAVVLISFAVQPLLRESSLSATYSFPPQTPNGKIRIVTWNIEFLGNRTPRRTPAQRRAIAERIRTFDAAVLVLQEVLRPHILNEIKSSLGPSWKIYASWWQNNAFLYDTSKVHMVSVEYLKYIPKAKGAPGTKWPGPWYRKPLSGVFRSVQMSSKTFHVIGVHCHWEKTEIRAAEGIWLSELIEALAEDPHEPLDFLLLGDFNDEPGKPPHLSLLETNRLHLLPKKNGDITHVSGNRIDHIYLSPSLSRNSHEESCFVVRPEYYNETPTDFRATYSDHLPVFVDIRL